MDSILGRHLVINSSLHEDIISRNYSFMTIEGKLKIIGPISRINLIIGANNSGKSNFMRGLFKSNLILFTTYNSEIINDVKEIADALIDKLYSIFDNRTEIKLDFISKQNLPHEFKNELEPLIELTKNASYSNVLNNNWVKNNGELLLTSLGNEKYENLKFNLGLIYYNLKLLSKISNNAYYTKRKNYSTHNLSYSNISANNEMLDLLESICLKINNILPKIEQSEITINNKYFLPTLRSSHPIFRLKPGNIPERIKDNILQDSFIVNYNLIDRNTKESLKFEEIITGMNLYETILRVRNEFESKRKGHEEFQQFISATFFNNKSFELVSKYSNDDSEQSILVKIGGNEHPIHWVGDGIQSLIILLYPIFTATSNSWFFIEEPENHLHPGFQRIFLEELSKNEYILNKNLTFFITSHSNHLLDISLFLNEKKSIFLFSEGDDAEHLIKNVDDGNTEVLSTLGVKNTSVYISNCSIWVEGISDRIYLKEFLRAYLKSLNNENKYKEDIDYNFFEYAGSNIMHYLFEDENSIDDESKINLNKINAKYLNNRILVVSDADNNKENKHNFFLSQVNRNFKYQILPVREIENLLSLEQLILALQNAHSGFKKIDWDKVNLKEKDYNDIVKKPYLGLVIKKAIEKSGQIFPKHFLDKTAIRSIYKVKMATTINDIDFHMLSENAKITIKEIFSFIEISNS